MKGNEDLRGKGGQNNLGGELGRRSEGGEGKGKDLRGQIVGEILGDKGLRGERGERISTGKGGKDLSEEKREDLGGERP